MNDAQRERIDRTVDRLAKPIEEREISNVLRVKINVDNPGVVKIGNRKYYCYQDDNDVLVVIPNWYRLTWAILTPVVLLFIVAWVLLWIFA